MDTHAHITAEPIIGFDDHSNDGGPSLHKDVRRAQPKLAATVSPVQSASGWYHDDAIEQARRDEIDRRCNPYR